MKKQGILWLGLSGLIVLSLVLASCGKTATPTTPATTATTTAPATTAKPTTTATTTPTTTAVMSQIPQYGGTINHFMGTKPAGFDPQTTTSGVDYFVLPAYEKPFQGDLDKYGPSGENKYSFPFDEAYTLDYLKPHLIESWEFSDPLTLVYHVRKGIHFQNKPPVNGREMDAYDMALSLTRLLEVPRFKTGYMVWVDTIKATDKNTVTIKLKTYNVLWKQYLGVGWYTGIEPRELVEQGLINKWQYVCGTGPFILTDYVEDVGARYEKNPDYWDTCTIDGKKYQIPFIDKLVVNIMPDPSARMAALRTGKVDVCWGINWVEIGPVLQGKPDLLHIEVPLTWEWAVFLRHDMPPMGDIRVRQALMMGLNHQEIIDKLYAGHGTPVGHFIVEGAPQYIPLKDYPADVRENWEYNPDKAKKLLTAAGYPNGFSCEMMINTTPENADMAALLIAYWAKIGVKVQLKVVESTVWVSLAYAKNNPMMSLGSESCSGNPLAAAQVISIPGSARNYSNWVDQKFIDIMNEGFAATDEATANEAIKKMQTYYMQQTPFVLICTPYVTTAWWPWVKNFHGERGAVAHTFSPVIARMWIDQALKKKTGY